LLWIFCGRKIKWLLIAMVVKINQEHLPKILMKNLRISISASTPKINVCLICNVGVALARYVMSDTA
jgi:hypothetical protein